MKSFLKACLIGSVLALSSFSALAQIKPVLGDLEPDASAKEILSRLDQTIFQSARIVLKDSRDDFIYRPPWDDTEPAKHTFMLTQGFRVTNIDGCNLMLRNDDGREIISPRMENSSYPVVVDLWVQLHRMSPDKGKRTYEHTKDPRKVRALGAWKSEYKYKGWSIKTMAELKLRSPGWDKPQKWQGYQIAFTFDTKEMSEQFDTAFRQAIRVCRSK